MEILKKIILISILVVGATLFIRCNKKSNDISKEKENKHLEIKDLSIYELIKNSIQANGELPEDFKLHQRILMEFLGQMEQWMEFIYIILL